MKKRRDLCLGRVSLEEVKRAGGCGADLVNHPRAPILRLCSGPPSVQTRSSLTEGGAQKPGAQVP